jgi:transposase-like protein
VLNVTRFSAERFLRKTLKATQTQMPMVINVDKNAVYPPTIDDLKAESQLHAITELWQVKYLNNLVEQEHRFIKRLTKLGMGFGSFDTARPTLRRMEAMHMILKGQVQGVSKGDVRASIELVP